MSDRASPFSGPFSGRTVALLALGGTALLVLFLVLSAYAPELRSGRNGGAHSMSTSAIGFRGIRDLLVATGSEVEYLRTDVIPAEEGLTVVTLHPGFDGARFNRLVEESWGNLLIVLPKWNTMPIPSERDRVQGFGAGQGVEFAPALNSLGTIEVNVSDTAEGTILPNGVAPKTRFRAPRELQTMAGPELVTIMETPDDEYVLANIDGTHIYILSDPDLINNQALAERERAEAALTLMTELAEGEPIRFDLITNGLGGSRNLLKLAFEPPFLAFTLCLLVLGLMVGWHVARRFGPPLIESRAIAFGKQALVDNSAGLLRLAGRERLSARRYVAAIRDRVIEAFGQRRGLEGVDRDAWLDKIDTGDAPRFGELAARLENARSREEIAVAARALHRWKRMVTHED